MEHLTDQYNRLNQVLKEIQQPSVTIDEAKKIYNEGTNISTTICKCIEGLRRDADNYTIK